MLFQTPHTQMTWNVHFYVSATNPTNQPKNQFNWQNIIRTFFSFRIELSWEWVEPIHKYSRSYTIICSSANWFYAMAYTFYAVEYNNFLSLFTILLRLCLLSHFHLCIQEIKTIFFFVLLFRSYPVHSNVLHRLYGIINFFFIHLLWFRLHVK